MVLRYVSAKDPGVLSMYMASLRGFRFSVVSGPVWADGRWYIWLSAEKGILKNNIDLDEV